MSEIKQLPTRDEVPTPLTWDLTKIFKEKINRKVYIVFRKKNKKSEIL